MSGVQFNDEDFSAGNFPYQNNSQQSGIVGWLVQKGLAKDQKAAEIILIIVTLVCFGIAIYLTIDRNRVPQANPSDLPANFDPTDPTTFQP
jgi:hypothetical protein